MKEFQEVLREYQEQEKHRTEGERGVQDLARLVHAMGYVDSLHFGQFQGAAYGDLINFLEDKPCSAPLRRNS